MTTELRIGKLHIGDRERFLALFEKCYGEPIATQTRRRFEWQYLQNPFLVDGEAPLIYGARLGSGDLVGCLGLIPFELSVEGRVVRAAWMADLVALPFVPDTSRTGKTLAEQIVTEVVRDLGLPFLGLGMSRAGERFWRRMGWWWFSGPTAMHADLTRMSPAKAGHNATSVSEGPRLADEDGLADFFAGIEVSDVAGTRHSFSYLDWKYHRHPYHAYRFHVARREGRVCGLLVTRVGDADYLGRALPCKRMWIAELLLQTQHADVLGPLLTSAREAAERAGAGELHVESSDPSAIDRLEGQGFLRRADVDAPMVYHPGSGPDRSIPKHWRVSRGDSDVDAL